MMLGDKNEGRSAYSEHLDNDVRVNNNKNNNNNK